ncbi:MAG TPA: DUF308 domain-containing protein [Tepidisphaeraceae bacterium]|nr:DUF308 domain-containing protein [Tepidisphaeraceae bacterium]
MADLERKGQVVAASAEAEFENYKATIATLGQTSQGEKDAAEAKRKSLGRSVTEVATPDYFKRNAIDAAKAKRQQNSSGRGGGGISERRGLFDILSIVLCTAIVGSLALGVFAPIPLNALGLLGFIIFGFAAFIWLVVVAFIDSWVQGLLVLFCPFYWLYYAFSQGEVAQGPGWAVAVFWFCGLILRPVLSHMRTSNTGMYARNNGVQRLDSMGEVVGSSAPKPVGMNGALPYYHRPQAEIQRILYYINIGTGLDGSLHPPAGFKQEFAQLLRDRIKANGLIEFDQAHLACFLHITDIFPHEQMFTESNGTYVPDDNGKVSVKVPYLRCTFSLDGDEGHLLHEEKKDIREIKEPIKASSPQELQEAVDAYQWKAAMDWYKALHLPDKPMWTEYDQGHWEQKVMPKTRPSQTQESSSPAPNAKATGQ